MRILLFHPATNYYLKSPSVPLGILSIATYARQQGHTVKVCDRCIEKENIHKTVKTFRPDIVGLSIMSSIGIKDAKRISEKMKRLQIPVIWGGHYPTFIYEDALKSGLVDAVILGEGEKTFSELLDEYGRNKSPRSLDHIDGLAYIRDGEIRVTRPRAFSPPEELPIIDYSLVDIPKYFETFYECEKMLYLYGSKGCPFACSFCYNPSYNNCQYRKRPTDHVFAEIDALVKNYGLDGIYFTDDVFCPKKKDLQEFCQKMRDRNHALVWGCQARVGQFDRDDFRLMYDSGCRWVFFGVETGNKEMQCKIGKNLDLSLVEETFKITRELGLVSISSLIVGLPDETEEQLRDTVNLAKRLEADLLPVNLYTPSIEQALAKELMESGRYHPPKTLDDYIKLKPTSEYIKSVNTIPKRDLLVIRSYFHWISFRGKGSQKASKSFGFARKAINDAIHNVMRFGVLYFVYAAFNSLKTFLGVVINVYCYPAVRRKYGLYEDK